MAGTPAVLSSLSTIEDQINNLATCVGNKKQLMERITRNSNDFYLLGQPPSGLNVESVKRANNPLFFVTNAQHELVGQSLRLEDLADDNLLIPQSGSGVLGPIEKVFAERGFMPRQQIELGGDRSHPSGAAGEYRSGNIFAPNVTTGTKPGC